MGCCTGTQRVAAKLSSVGFVVPDCGCPAEHSPEKRTGTLPAGVQARVEKVNLSGKYPEIENGALKYTLNA